jgi:hypothetical protein
MDKMSLWDTIGILADCSGGKNVNRKFGKLGILFHSYPITH